MIVQAQDGDVSPVTAVKEETQTEQNGENCGVIRIPMDLQKP
jgi:hypothetical protein